MGGDQRVQLASNRPESNVPVPSGTPDWLTHIIKTIPDYDPHPSGKQFNPKDVPVIPGSPAGQLYYEPMFSGHDAQLMVALQRLMGGMI